MLTAAPGEDPYLTGEYATAFVRGFELGPGLEGEGPNRLCFPCLEVLLVEAELAAGGGAASGAGAATAA